MSRKRNDKGRFETAYDWPVLIPRICEQFMNGASLGTICAQPGYPTPWAVWNACNSTPEYKKEWLLAVRAQMYLLTDELGEIGDMCKEAFHNRGLDPVALLIMMNVVLLKYSNLERILARHGAVRRPWTGRVEQSLEDEMQAARKRAWGHIGPKSQEPEHGMEKGHGDKLVING